ncbi:MAG: PHP domain-containing protein [Clostridia bacterium]
MIFGDYHTHSKYSKLGHGKNTIRQMAESGVEKGLKEMAITDHGSRHLFFGVRKNALKKARQEINIINAEGKIHLYLGLEANLISRSGKIDIRDSERQYLDFTAMGFHRGSWGEFANIFNFNLSKRRQNNPEIIKKNTDAYISAILQNNITFLTHLQEYIRVDVKKIAEVCADTGTMIEINNRHLRFSAQDVTRMLETGVKFVLSSDAHNIKQVADVSNAIKFAQVNHIPAERICNLNEGIKILKL